MRHRKQPHILGLALRAAALAAVLVLGAAFWSARATQDDPRLEDLFKELQAAKNPMDARLFEDAIWRVWLQTGDRELDRLMREGTVAMNTGRTEIARARYDEVIRRAPDYAEGWNKRATLHFLLRDYDASITDIDRTLALEPRHFGALAGLGQIRDALEQPDRALDAYERALAVNPHLILARERVRQLQDFFRQQAI